MRSAVWHIFTSKYISFKLLKREQKEAGNGPIRREPLDPLCPLYLTITFLFLEVFVITFLQLLLTLTSLRANICQRREEIKIPFLRFLRCSFYQVFSSILKPSRGRGKATLRMNYAPIYWSKLLQLLMGSSNNLPIQRRLVVC